jgi:sensor histidine kinase regulating citrate/malate metabolism
MLRSGSKENFQPRIIVSFNRSEDSAELKIMDNGGGVSPEQVKLLYREPVPSLKREGKKPGQGTLFVKFFSERMEMDVRAENSMERGEEGLEVMIKIPLYGVSRNDEE